MKILAFAATLFAATPALASADSMVSELNTAGACRTTFQVLLNLHAATASTLLGTPRNDRAYTELVAPIRSLNLAIAALAAQNSTGVATTVKDRILPLAKENGLDETTFFESMDRVFATIDTDSAQVASKIALDPENAPRVIRALHDQAVVCAKWIKGE